MKKIAVKNYDLRRLVGFLNLEKSKLENFDRAAARPQFDGSDENLFLATVVYMTGFHDNSETLVRLQDDIREHLTRLLNPEIPATKALEQLLQKIDGIDLKGSRAVYNGEVPHYLAPRNVEIIRVVPPGPNQKGKQRPKVESIPVVEYEHDDSAEAAFYRIIDAALRNNTISIIRCCLHCKTFFLRTKSRLTYCAKTSKTSCETAFNNERRRVKRLLEPKKKKLRRRKNVAKIRAGQELFERLQGISEEPKISNEDRKFVARVRARVALRPEDLKHEWSKLQSTVRKDLIRAAETLTPN